MKKLTIIGASGHGKVVADIAKLNGYDEIVFLDDNETVKCCGNYPVVGSSSEVVSHNNEVFVAIGNASIRKKIMEQFLDKTFPVLIHPNTVIAEGVKIGKGTVIMAGVVVNADTVIGEGCIINTSSSVDHDCLVGDYVHVAVGSHLCGTVTVGNETWIGAGATVSNNINICDSCMVGAGSVVVKDIKEKGIYIGVPARLKYE
jgi:sugar O-acyltransferase, sialic acid O-acetyltransferase NeuD family